MILIDAYRNLIFLMTNFINVNWNLTLKTYLKTFHSFNLIFENTKTSKNFFLLTKKTVLINLFWNVKLIESMFKFLNAKSKDVKTLASTTLLLMWFLLRMFNFRINLNNFSIIFFSRMLITARFFRCRFIVFVCLLNKFLWIINCFRKLIIVLLFLKSVNDKST